MERDIDGVQHPIDYKERKSKCRFPQETWFLDKIDIGLIHSQ